MSRGGHTPHGRLSHTLRTFALALACAAASACSSKATPKQHEAPAEDTSWAEDDEFVPTPLPPVKKIDDPDDPNKLVYLVSNNRSLYSFSPRTPGRAAYHLVGKLDCPSRGSPQTMAVDRNSTAWVFYDTGELFKVSINDASCKPTSYTHPIADHLLGMGFTSVSPGSPEEKLYMVSRIFGLATVSMPDLKVEVTHKLAAISELTGGGDAKLFRFEAQKGELAEIDLQTYKTRLVHKFSNLWNVAAFAFARYAGRFYIFTSPDDWAPSSCTVYDPKTNTEDVRDTNIGFVVVGAGQSTLVPRGDAAPDQVTGTFPEELR
jgi:hypothetical protein